MFLAGVGSRFEREGGCLAIRGRGDHVIGLWVAGVEG